MSDEERSAAFCRRLGIEHPIVQAPMAGGMTTTDLVVATSEAGALGSIAGGALTPQRLTEEIRTVRARTKRPFAVNLFVLGDSTIDTQALQRAYDLLARWRDELGVAPGPLPTTFAQDGAAQFAAAVAERPAIVSFTFEAMPPDRMRALQAIDAFVLGTATSVAEARHLQSDGAHAIVAQGSQAGGHRGTFLGDARDALTDTMTLVQQVAAAVDLPIIAAGGIMNGADIAAALRGGAAAVQMGTAFLNTVEAGTHPLHRAALTDPATTTAITRVLSGKYVRAIRNRLTDGLEPHAAAIPPYPVQNALTTPIRAAAARENRADLMVMLAGVGHRQARNLPAADLIRALLDEMRDPST